jgi:hypothetical protein
MYRIKVLSFMVCALMPAAMTAQAVTTTGGTANTIPVFAGSTSIVNSSITQSGNNVNVAGSLAVGGSVTSKNINGSLNEEGFAGSTVAARVDAAAASCSSSYTSSCIIKIPSYAPPGNGWTTTSNNAIIIDERVNNGQGIYSNGSVDPLANLHGLYQFNYHAGANDPSETIYTPTASTVLGCSISGNIVACTTTNPNSYISGEKILIANMSNLPYLNSNLNTGNPYTVLNSGLSGTQFQFAYDNGNVTVPYTADNGITGVACTFCGKNVLSVMAFSDAGATTNGSNASLDGLSIGAFRSSAVTTANTTPNSNTISVASAAGIAIGQTAIASPIPVNTVVTGIYGTTITLSNAASANSIGASIVFTSTRQTAAGVFANHCYLDGNPSHFCEGVEIDTGNSGPDDLALAGTGLTLVNTGSKTGIGIRLTDVGGSSADGWEYGESINNYHEIGIQLNSGDTSRISDITFVPPANDSGMELQGQNAANNFTIWRIDDSGNISTSGAVTAGGHLMAGGLSVNNSVTNSTGIQHIHGAIGCTTAASIGATCTSPNLGWGVPFADTNFSLVCSLDNATGVPVITSEIKGTFVINIVIAALTPTAATANYDCIAMHS